MGKKNTYKNDWKSLYLFLGLFLFLTGLLFLLINSGIIPYPYTIRRLWPLTGIFCAIALLCSGLYRRKRLGVSYLVPSALLILLSLLFLLFSMHIISISFRQFAITWWPLCLVIPGIALVVLFFIRSSASTALSTVIIDDGDNIDDIADFMTQGGEAE
jgi:hypothetical protein